MFESLLDGTLENYTTCVSTDYFKKCLCTFMVKSFTSL